jgi:predicted dehydrogenase
MWAERRVCVSSILLFCPNVPISFGTVQRKQDGDKAAALAAERRIPHSFSSIAEAVRFAPLDAIFDVAVPASQLVHILPQLSDSVTVLIQKPMGETLQEARIIRDLCRSKGFTAAVNFSLRYSPNNLAVAALASSGLLGEIHDIEVQTSTYTLGISGRFLPPHRGSKSFITAFTTSTLFDRGWAILRAFTREP